MITYDVLIRGRLRTFSLNVYLILRNESSVIGAFISISNSIAPRLSSVVVILSSDLTCFRVSNKITLF